MLTDADHREVLAVLGELAAPAEGEELSRRVLRAVRRVVPGDVVTLNDVDPSADRFLFASDPDDFPVPDDARDVLAEFAAEHPLVRYVRRTGDGSAMRISDVASLDEFHGTALYQRFYGKAGVEYQMSITLALPLPAVVAIVVSRGDQDFSDAERDRLELMRPHLSAWWLQASEVARLAGLLGAAGSPAEPRTSMSVALTEPVRELTTGALQELYGYFGRPEPRTSLPATVLDWLDGDAERVPLAGAAGASQAVLRLVPAADGRPAVLLLQSGDRAAGAEPSGLSRRETEILGRLIGGGTNQEIAAALHIAPGTVKKHLDSVYAKLGVRGRVQAVARAIELGLTAPE